MSFQYPWEICKNEVKDKDLSICAEICNIWGYTEFVDMSPKNYEKLKNDDLVLGITTFVSEVYLFQALPFSSDTLGRTQKTTNNSEKTEKTNPQTNENVLPNQSIK